MSNIKGGFCGTAVLVLMVGAWWILNRMNANSEHNQAGSCPAGDLTLVVAAQDNPQVQSLLDSYKKSNPVVKDRCVKTEVVGEVANAALALIPGTKETVNARLQIAGRSASTNNYPVALRTSLGIAELKEGGDSHEHSHDEHEHEHLMSTATMRIHGLTWQATASSFPAKMPRSSPPLPPPPSLEATPTAPQTCCGKTQASHLAMP